MEAFYKKDQLHGVRKLYDSTGVLKEVSDYKEGKAEGLVKFYKGDQLLSVYNYSNDLAEGRFQDYNKDGSLSRDGYMRKGMKSGVHYFYDSVGNLGSTKEYKLVNGKSKLNQWWNFARDSTIKVETSHFATAEIKNDSIHFELVAPFFEGLGRVLIGDFDNQFIEAPDTTMLPMVNQRLVISKDYYSNSDTLRAIVQDYKGSGDNIRIKNIYLEVPLMSNTNL